MRLGRNLIFLSLGFAEIAWGFSGFYVGKSASVINNRDSEVVMVRDGNRTVLTLSGDFEGDSSDFAWVIPVPTLLAREQINVVDPALLSKLDAYSAPRLVETYDSDPCGRIVYHVMNKGTKDAAGHGDEGSSGKVLGVTVEAHYTVGEYDTQILSAKESRGLEAWLVKNGYRLPPGAEKKLAPYLEQNQKFLVVKIDLKEQAKTGFSFLRPLQIAFDSPKFTLPLRLGTINASGPQDLVVYSITRNGRMQAANYRNAELPTGEVLPLFVKDRLPDLYRAGFDTAYENESRKGVFLEYAWNVASCAPCAADPLTKDELLKLGVSWLDDAKSGPSSTAHFNAFSRPPVEAFLTRMHIRYDAEHFPEDPAFEETSNEENFQIRYVVRHAWTGAVDCELGQQYEMRIKSRREKEAENLASLTGWKLAEIRRQMGDFEEMNSDDAKSKRPKKWYDKLFK